MIPLGQQPTPDYWQLNPFQLHQKNTTAHWAKRFEFVNGDTDRKLGLWTTWKHGLLQQEFV
jgi:hypothetical protein